MVDIIIIAQLGTHLNDNNANFKILSSEILCNATYDELYQQGPPFYLKYSNDVGIYMRNLRLTTNNVLKMNFNLLLPLRNWQILYQLKIYHHLVALRKS